MEPLVFVLLTIALFQLWRRGPRTASILILALLLGVPLLLGGQDLLRGGGRVVRFRYWQPSVLAMLLAVTWFLAERRSRLYTIFQAAAFTALLFVAGRQSYETFLDRVPPGKPDSHLLPVADAIRSSRDPLVVSPALVMTPLILSVLLPPETPFVFLGGADDLSGLDHFSTSNQVFILATMTSSYEPRAKESEETLSAIRQSYVLEPVNGAEGLLRVRSRAN
jgi:hypothetical protein